MEEGLFFQEDGIHQFKIPLAMSSRPYLGDWANINFFGKLAPIPFQACNARSWGWRQPQRSHSFHSILLCIIFFTWRIYLSYLTLEWTSGEHQFL